MITLAPPMLNRDNSQGTGAWPPAPKKRMVFQALHLSFVGESVKLQGVGKGSLAKRSSNNVT